MNKLIIIIFFITSTIIIIDKLHLRVRSFRLLKCLTIFINPKLFFYKYLKGTTMSKEKSGVKKKLIEFISFIGNAFRFGFPFY